MKRLAAAALAALLPCLALAAGERASLAVQVARTTITEDGWKKTIQAISLQTQQYIEASARQAGTPIPPEMLARLSEELANILTYQEQVDLYAGLLAKHYTDPELRELLAFYRTPLGQKTIRIMPEVSADANGQMLAIMQQRLPGVIERLKTAFDGSQPPAKAPAAAPAKKAGAR